MPARTTPCSAVAPRFERAAPPFVAEPVDLSLELPALLASAAPLAVPHGCRLEHAVPPGITVRTDPRILREAMAEVLAHAVRQASGRVLVTAQRNAGEVTVKVCDDGAGLDGASQQRGLQGAVQVLALQGARLAVEARSGQGTIILIRTPDVAAFAPTAPPPHATVSG